MHEFDTLIEQQIATWPAPTYRPFSLDEARALRGSAVSFTTSVLGLKAISCVIEEHAAGLGRPVEVFAGFQKLSNAQAQQARYQAILDTGSQVYLFGEPDWAGWDHPGLHLVPIGAAHSLADVWVVALCDPRHISMAVLARELPGPNGRPRRQGSGPDRRFEGFQTSDATIVDRLAADLRRHAGNTPMH